MKNILLSVPAMILLIGSALAADATEEYIASSWYVGGNVGFNYQDDVLVEDSQKNLGAIIGYQYDENLAAEASFVYLGEKPGIEGGQAVTLNGLAMLPTDTFVTPYALAGLGVGFNGLGNDGEAQPIYNIGAGARFSLTDSWDLDARYTWIDSWVEPIGANSLSIGLNYKF